MANVFEGGGGGIFSVRPPRAPIPSVLRKRMRGAMGGQARLGGAARLKALVMQRMRGGGGGIGDWLEQEGQLNQPQQQQIPADFNPLEGMPTDLSGLGAQQWGQPQEDWHDRDPMMAVAQRVRALRGRSQQATQVNQELPDADIRERILQRYTTATPQAPALTSRGALQKFLQRRPRHAARKPMLPPRRSFGVRPY